MSAMAAVKARRPPLQPEINVESLQHQLKLAHERVTKMDTTLINVLEKNKRLEKELDHEHQKNRGLTFELKGKEEQVRLAKAAQASDQTSTVRERGLKEQNDKLKMENFRLHGQLQAEKAGNLGRLYGKQRDSCQAEFDQDDEEDARSMTESTRTTPMPPYNVRTLKRSLEVSKAPATFPKPNAFAEFHSFRDYFDTGIKDETRPTKKQRRTRQEEVEEELSDLQLDGFKMPTKPRKKKPSATVVDDAGFEFSAIYDYDSQRNPLFMDADEVNNCEMLQKRIHQTKDVWEHNKGMKWDFDFKINGYNPTLSPCVTQRNAGLRTNWRRDCGGKYACRDCVNNGRPCFTWTEVETNKNAKSSEWRSVWEFQLLPLHPTDRTGCPGKGNTVLRYWVNEKTAFQDKDVRNKDDGDEEYVD